MSKSMIFGTAVLAIASLSHSALADEGSPLAKKVECLSGLYQDQSSIALGKRGFRKLGPKTFLYFSMDRYESEMQFRVISPEGVYQYSKSFDSPAREEIRVPGGEPFIVSFGGPDHKNMVLVTNSNPLEPDPRRELGDDDREKGSFGEKILDGQLAKALSADKFNQRFDDDVAEPRLQAEAKVEYLKKDLSRKAELKLAQRELHKVIKEEKSGKRAAKLRDVYLAKIDACKGITTADDFVATTKNHVAPIRDVKVTIGRAERLDDEPKPAANPK